MGVVEQVRQAFRPQARLATVLGGLLGGFVPLATYVVAHREIDPGRSLWTQWSVLLVLGGLLYSARTVYDWGRQAFHSGAKAAGFVLLLEGVMVTSRVEWLALAALGYLVGVNALATGCNLSRGPGGLDRGAPASRAPARGVPAKSKRKPAPKPAIALAR